MRVFVAGGSGFVGRHLVPTLVARGDEVVVLSRSEPRARKVLGNEVEIVEGDPRYGGDWQKAVDGCTGVINLVGESVAARRWNAHFRQQLRDSRLDSTRLIVEAIASSSSPPAVLVNASGIDYYPFSVDLEFHRGAFDDEEIAEDAPPGDSFMARLCRDWEAEAVAASARVVLMRTGLVLGDGPATKKLAAPFKFFVGGKLGSGDQWVSWIHIDDAVGAYLFALDSGSLEGPVNLVTDSVRNRDLARALAKALRRPSLVPVPGFAVRAVAGQLAEYILNGRRAVPAKLRAAGYTFQHPDLEGALRSATQ
jgi:uncharacterized protein (TIGR01777 family)